MSRTAGFVHLRVHTEYSLLEGAVRLGELPDLCRRSGMPAVAVTDTNNMFSALEFSVSAMNVGIQPIVGCQVDLALDGTNPEGGSAAPAPVVLLAQSREGYQNLLKLNSRLYLREASEPHVTLADMERHAEGLICLTGGPDGPLGRLCRSGRRDAADALLGKLAATFPERLYVELQRHPTETGQLPEPERHSERPSIEMAYERGLPLVATNDVHFRDSDMYEAHDALICIAEGTYVDQQADRRRFTQQHYFKSPAEMAALFADLPETIENTLEIAHRCAYVAETRDPILPRFAEDEVEELRRQAKEGLEARLAVIEPAAPREEYESRLTFELDTIEGMGFPGYFLIVADIIKWAKSNAIPVGPGRGSGAGSLVAYALTITDLDPLRYSLFFERFLNPERVSMPDFDIDFCMARREEVINYVQKKYGSDRVAQIITFGALLSKAAVRDVGRVLQMPYGQVDRLSKLIPVEGVRPISIERARKEEPRLAEAARAEEVVDRLLNYGQQVEGLLRNASTHAAGVVIGDRPLDELVPLYRDPRSEMPATQFNMKWVEQAGLVKYDLLGLKTLTVIQNALDLLNARGIEIDIGQIPLDDKKAYDLYSSARTVAVFQVEGSGMMDALRRMKPTCIEDIVALVALYRPGPMESIPEYCDVKNGRAERTALHPLIDHVLDETQGIIVYQEQVMQIAQEMAGYSLGGADLLRRAMGKKIKSAMDAERPNFMDGSRKNGVDDRTARKIWDLLEKFADYGFNKSHAAAYAVVSYQTAWLKANYPVEFMAGVMNCDIHLSEKLGVYAEEVRRGLEIEIVPPCVNRSESQFAVSEGKLVYALGALKNIGLEATRLITDARGDKPFVNVFDFARRVDLRQFGKRSLETLVRSGALDELDRNRRRVLDSLDALVAYSAAVFHQSNSNQGSLFGDAGEDLPEPRLASVEDWLPNERLEEERAAIGFYLSGHPLDDYAVALKLNGMLTLAELRERAERDDGAVGRVGVIVSGLQERKSSRGTKFFRMNISDPTGQVTGIALFPENFAEVRRVLEGTSQVIMSLEARSNEGQFDPVGRSAVPIEGVVTAGASAGIDVLIDAPDTVASIASVLTRFKDDGSIKGRGPVRITAFSVPLPDGATQDVPVDIGGDWPVSPQIKGALKSLPGVLAVEDLAI